MPVLNQYNNLSTNPIINPIYITVAGPRDYTDSEFVYSELDKILSRIINRYNRRIHIIEGGAAGVDAIAKQYAISRNMLFTEVKAEWDKFGRSAGPIRNGKMAEMSDFCIAFYRGSNGTASMINEALKRKKQVYLVSVSNWFGVGKTLVIHNFEEWNYFRKEF